MLKMLILRLCFFDFYFSLRKMESQEAYQKPKRSVNKIANSFLVTDIETENDIIENQPSDRNSNALNLDAAEFIYLDDMHLNEEPVLTATAAVTENATNTISKKKENLLFSRYFTIIERDGNSLRAECNHCKSNGTERIIKGKENVSSNFISHLRVRFAIIAS